MWFSKEKLAEIQRKVSLEEIVSQYTKLRSRGGHLTGLCPLHTEKTPSFRINTELNLWYCFGCGKGGNIFRFMMECEKMNFAESLRFLAEKAGVEPDMKGDYEKGQEQWEARQRLYQLMTRACEMFEIELAEGGRKEAFHRYLERRGVLEESLKTFRLGCCPKRSDRVVGTLIKAGFLEEELARSGLFKADSKPLWCYLVDRLVFPIREVSGKVVAFGGRALGEEKVKYLNTSESEIYKKGALLYGLFEHRRKILDEEKAILVEGYLDVIALSQAGFPYAVAPLGTAFTEEQAVLLKRYTKKVVLLFDQDRAGIQATMKALKICEKEGLRTFVVQLPEGEDPDSLLSKYGAQAMQHYLASGLSGMEFVWKLGEVRFDKSTPEGKQDFVEWMVGFLSLISEDVRRRDYVKTYANRLGVASHLFMEHLRGSSRIQEREMRASMEEREVAQKMGPSSFAGNEPEVRLLQLVVQKPKWRELVNKKFRRETWELDADWLRSLDKILQGELSEVEWLESLPQEVSKEWSQIVVGDIPDTTKEDLLKLIGEIHRKHDIARLAELRKKVFSENQGESLSDDNEDYQEYLRIQRMLKGVDE